MIVLGTRALLAAHERMCMEDRERTRQMFKELKDEIAAVEIRSLTRLEKIDERAMQRFDAIEAQMNNVALKVAAIVGGVGVLAWAIEHFHMLAHS